MIGSKHICLYSRAGGRWLAGWLPKTSPSLPKPSQRLPKSSQSFPRHSQSFPKPPRAEFGPSLQKESPKAPTCMPIMSLNIGYLNGGIVRSELARSKYANDPSIERFQDCPLFFTKIPSLAPEEFRTCFIKELNGVWRTKGGPASRSTRIENIDSGAQ